MVKARAGGQEGHTIPAADASICSSLCQAVFEEVLIVNKGSITKPNKQIFLSKIYPGPQSPEKLKIWNNL